jgi:hypothetical protein
VSCGRARGATVGLFVYPWDLSEDGAEAVLDATAQLGASRVDLAVTYHSGEVLRPRSPHATTYVIEGNRLHLPLDGLDAVATEHLAPSSIAREHPELVPGFVEASAARGVRVGAWVTLLHNSTIATEAAHLSQRDCFGVASTHGLCPANPATLAYAVGLVAAVAASRLFDRALVESPGHLMAGHGHPHEIVGVPDGPLPRYLRSLCFCEHCRARAREAGIDGDALADGVRTILRGIWNSCDPTAGTSLADLLGLLQMWPELAAFAAERQRTVTGLVGELVDAAGPDLTVMVNTATWAGPVQASWQEGLDLVGLARRGAGLLVPTYGRAVEDVRDELAFVRTAVDLAGGADVAIALRLWPTDHRDQTVLDQKVRAVLDHGFDQIMLYNYSTATSATLRWASAPADE